ncbi:hypothetical protein RRG08_047394 [Elysia crispata]|uniref:Uncharacterized protein n=1 Tax=Elysia crispata TaxID=231223 RepID=A0AAE0YUA9_9GAST|nr:hypothetical protein RRG08_047394 [Elysia crispata]
MALVLLNRNGFRWKIPRMHRLSHQGDTCGLGRCQSASCLKDLPMEDLDHSGIRHSMNINLCGFSRDTWTGQPLMCRVDGQAPWSVSVVTVIIDRVMVSPVCPDQRLR